MSELFIVATPIGNLEDLTYSAVRILTEVNFILAEDTRTTGILLKKYSIENKKLISYNAKNQEKRNLEALKLLEEQNTVALVTDAGTPGVSDPGYSLVKIVRENGYKITAIPGASALTAFLSIAGAGTHAWTFYGFLPHKNGRQTLLKEMLASDKSSIFYESTHRLLKFLEEWQKLDSDNSRTIVIGKELTKIHEEILSGTAPELLEIFAADPQKVRGEFVVMVA